MTENPKQAEVVRVGKLVALTYSIRDEQGNILEQTDLPVTYIHGGNSELIGGMDQAVTGKAVGDEVELSLSPERSGFGPRDPELTFTDVIENVPTELRHVGAEVSMQNDAGEVRTFYVTRIVDGRLTVDGNHPFAGKHLIVNVRIHEVRDPTPAELTDDVGDTPRVLH
jgi:FKBP-type peptidyl-prolyl cis-trans isomerase SlyD